MNSMLRFEQMRAFVPLSRSRIFALVREGLLPPPVKISSHASAWRADEISAVIDARTRGESTEAIAQLVRSLVAQRATAGRDAQTTAAPALLRRPTTRREGR